MKTILVYVFLISSALSASSPAPKKKSVKDLTQLFEEKAQQQAVRYNLVKTHPDRYIMSGDIFYPKQNIWFIAERITPKSAEFWLEFSRKKDEPEYKDPKQSKKEHLIGTIGGISAGLSAFNSTLQDMLSNELPNTQRTTYRDLGYEPWVCYVHVGKLPKERREIDQKNQWPNESYQQVEMVITGLIHPQGPIYIPVGITRNTGYLHQKNPLDLHAKLSIPLHIFVANLAKRINPKVKYMYCPPTPNMYKILLSTLGEKHIQGVFSSKDILNFKNQIQASIKHDAKITAERLKISQESYDILLDDIDNQEVTENLARIYWKMVYNRDTQPNFPITETEILKWEPSHYGFLAHYRVLVDANYLSGLYFSPNKTR